MTGRLLAGLGGTLAGLLASLALPPAVLAGLLACASAALGLGWLAAAEHSRRERRAR